jgi:hypothetical protein
MINDIAIETERQWWFAVSEHRMQRRAVQLPHSQEVRRRHLELDEDD